MRYLFGKKYICTYCGEPADCIDHTIPYSWFKNTGSKKRKSEAVGFMTYSCRECNSLLSDKVFYTFQDRLLYLNRRLRERHKKELTVLWDEEDLKTVSDRLKQYILQSNNRCNLIRKRLGWINSKEFQNMMKDVYEDVYFNKSLTEKQKEYFIDTDFTPE